MAGWTKLFSSIVTSSVWCEDDHTLRVWIAMLAMSDSEGLVEGSVPGLANLCRVTPEQMRHALDRLTSPDPDSRTKAHDGRRIEAFDGGWKILNYLDYRDRGQAKEGSRAPYYRRYRAQQKPVARNTEDRRDRQEANTDPQASPSDTAARPQPLRPPTSERPANPLVAGRRVDLEREFLALVSEIAKLTDRDPLEVAREATGYEGARTTPINPASMSDDRLANSVMDLRSNLGAVKKRKEAESRGIREARR